MSRSDPVSRAPWGSHQAWYEKGSSARGLMGCGGSMAVVLAGAAVFGVLTGEPGEYAAPVATAAVPALLIIAAMVVMLPRATATQGVAVDATGITLVHEARWWFAGRTHSVPWYQVSSAGVVAVASAPQEAGRPRPVSITYLVITVTGEPPERTPGWARVVPAGTSGPHGDPPSPAARIFVHLPTGSPELHEAIGRIRPDLARGEPVPAAPPAPAPPAARPQQQPFHHAPPQWVDLRAFRPLTYSFTLLSALALAIAIGIALARQWSQDYIGASEISGGVLFLVLSVVVAVWTACVLPRAFARQGVAADAGGVTLVQEAKWWSGGRTVHFPWEEVVSFSHDLITVRRHSGNGVSRARPRPVVRLTLRFPDRAAKVPTWATPAHVVSYATITPPRRLQPDVLAALRSIRPDLERHPAGLHGGSPYRS